MASSHHHNQDKDSTLYVGNLDERCTDALVWELMLQCGPVINVHLPKDRVTQNHQGYGFVEFGSEEDADYAAKIMNQIRVWGKPIRVNKASADRRGGPVGGPGAEGGGLGGGQGVGAELFVGNLDSMVDEKVLYDTFSRFGPLIQAPKIARDDSNLSKGYGFISYADFDASDEAINNMHGQYLMNREITVQYAYKKDGKGERHGDAAERALAAQAKKHGVQVQIPAMPASLVLPVGAPSAPAAMQNGFSVPPTPTGMNGSVMAPRAPQPPPTYNPYGAAAPYAQPPTPTAYGMPAPPMAFAPLPAPSPAYQNGGGAPPNRAYNQSPLQAPPGAGLPARPPASVGGYGGPPMGVAPGMPGAPPPTFNPPPGFAPPGPPGPPGMPPGGFQPPGANGYQRR
ncbi:RNA-binding domain-containing protein [Teratosphaeria nubilosa]|uniref:RNA-binding domain-containing protein n=1 Tax=Teratosphaeria nubilosa TaxID=161662 RepID=A0A6G1L6H4_9PEZI|nr:RNA-binding domain-containing protein [Teratosphaeria nubilosa]